MPIDEAVLTDYISKLSDLENTLNNKLNQLRSIRFSLNKLKKIVTGSSTDQSGNITYTYGNPLDPDMGNNPMDDTKRQAIYDFNTPLADAALKA